MPEIQVACEKIERFASFLSSAFNQDIASWNHFHWKDMIVPESHNGAFAIVLSDLLQGQIQVLFAGGVRRIGRTHLGVFGWYDTVMISEDDMENK